MNSRVSRCPHPQMPEAQHDIASIRLVSDATLDRARGGDERAFRQLTDPFRRELQLHCYRILGSVQDAEDLVQETLLAAWRGLPEFEGRSSLRSWLYRIATNRCLNLLRDRSRRPEGVPSSLTEPPEPTRWAEPTWLEPYPNALLEGLPDRADGPEARYETREAVSLAFVTGLQRLAPAQRAALVLRDVLGFRASEAAEMLDTSEASVNSALQRARGALESAALPAEGRGLPRARESRELLGRFADAFEEGDVDGVVALLTEDAWTRMPPQPHEYQGHAAIARFLATRPIWNDGRTVRLLPAGANGQPAFVYYLADPGEPVARASGLLVLQLEGEEISAITRCDVTAVLAHLDLPPTIPVA
jgi:RNA polymerase sigma-70 factor (TIGR02960 family)